MASRLPARARAARATGLCRLNNLVLTHAVRVAARPLVASPEYQVLTHAARAKGSGQSNWWPRAKALV